jgi:hypothetical protein
VELEEVDQDQGLETEDCPSRESPKRVVKRPARPYKNAIQNRFTMGDAKGA